MRPTTSRGDFVAGYATSTQVREEMERRGFWYSYDVCRWRHADGSVVTEGMELDFLSAERTREAETLTPEEAQEQARLATGFVYPRR